MSRETFKLTAAAIAVFAAMTAPAHAYIDPGAGSMILQGIIGGVAGGLFIMRTYWAKAVAFFSGGRKNAPAESIGEAGQPRTDA